MLGDICNHTFIWPTYNLTISRTIKLRSSAMDTNDLYPRFASERLKEALADTPTVLIHGPRQCGKTTLTRMFAEPLGYTYFSFDDPVLSSAAQSDPIGFVDDLPEKAILDEVQRVPEIFPAIKTAVDRNRISGS